MREAEVHGSGRGASAMTTAPGWEHCGERERDRHCYRQQHGERRRALEDRSQRLQGPRDAPRAEDEGAAAPRRYQEQCDESREQRVRNAFRMESQSRYRAGESPVNRRNFWDMYYVLAILSWLTGRRF